MWELWRMECYLGRQKHVVLTILHECEAWAIRLYWGGWIGWKWNVWRQYDRVWLRKEIYVVKSVVERTRGCTEIFWTCFAIKYEKISRGIANCISSHSIYSINSHSTWILFYYIWWGLYIKCSCSHFPKLINLPNIYIMTLIPAIIATAAAESSFMLV